MNVAFVTADLPGSRPTGYHAHTLTLLEALAERHDVALLCYDPSAPASARTGGKLARPWDRMAELRSLAGRTTRVEAQFAQARTLAGLRRAIAAHPPDRILFNHLRAAWALPRLAPLDAPAAYVAHNAEGALAASAAANMPATWRPLARREARHLATLEASVAATAGFATTLTAEDAERLRLASPGLDVTVVPPRVPVATTRPQAAISAMPAGLLLVGSFHWRPKRANAAWLVREILPRVRARHPGTGLVVAGSGASRLRRLAGSGVELRPDPEDISTLYNEGRIAVVPERQVGGLKLKVLEAAAHEAPIVTTRAGAEGTGLRDGEDCLVADSADGFAAAIHRFLSEDGLARKLGDSARRRMSRWPADGTSRGLETLLRRMGDGDA